MTSQVGVLHPLRLWAVARRQQAAGIWQKASGLSIFTRIAIGNSIILILGAIGGTLIIRLVTERGAELAWIILMVSGGVLLSIALNLYIVKTLHARHRPRLLHPRGVPHPHARWRQALHRRLRSARHHPRLAGPYEPHPIQRRSLRSGPVGRAARALAPLPARRLHLRPAGRPRPAPLRGDLRPQDAAPRRQARPADVDESTDAYDTIAWLLQNVRGHNGKVGIVGTSYPGFYTSASCIDAHPALVACSPQAPMTDVYTGDDAFHFGAFNLASGWKPER